MSRSLPRVIISFQPADVSVLERYREHFEFILPHNQADVMPTEELRLALAKETFALIHSTVNIKINAEWLEALKKANVKIVANHGAGYDGVDVEKAAEHQIYVSNTPGAVSAPTADLAFALLLAMSRRITEGDEYVREGKWKTKTLNSFMMGTDPSGKTLAIVGLGGIGKALAKRAKAFDMKVVYHNRNPISTAEEHALGATYYAKLDDMLHVADFVSVHCPLSAETRYMFGKHQFEQMKEGVFFINTARGPLVRDEALLAALHSGKVRAAALDVHENEPEIAAGYFALPRERLILLPHVGTQTVESRTNMLLLCLDNVVAVLHKSKPLTPVNSF